MTNYTESMRKLVHMNKTKQKAATIFAEITHTLVQNRYLLLALLFIFFSFSLLLVFAVAGLFVTHASISPAEFLHSFIHSVAH